MYDDDGVESFSLQGCLCNKFLLYCIFLMPYLVFRICCSGLCWPPHTATKIPILSMALRFVNTSGHVPEFLNWRTVFIIPGGCP